ncbi:DMT family transporter [Alkalimarinus sediminis]|uniref:DMT family transporter n=1 Tax=Alkalimarinus sediminis TaxID=1632866 RepID=A0A9E8KNV9_9ALTE|nr:DMT family transporter [Alkalimarinus sediminis]UZW73580.1 DMT family transporter [Alkalimarinus sediminis]
MPFIALIVATFLWGSSFIALKIAFVEFHPSQVIFFRMFVATLCFMLMFRRLGKIDYQAGDWKYLVGMCLFEPCLYFVFESIALKNTSASQAGVITSLLPLMVAVGAYFFLKEQLSKKAIAGFIVAVCGAIALSLLGSETELAPNPVLGNFFEFLAMACACGYTLILKHLTLRYSALFLTALQAASGAVFFLPAALWFPFPVEYSSSGVFAMIYLGIAVSIGAYGLYNYAVSKIPASQATAYINFIPVFTIIIAFFVLGERLSIWEIAACGVIVTGILLSKSSTKN